MMHGPSHRFALTFFTCIIVIWLIAMFAIMRVAALRPDDRGVMLVVFEPGTKEDQAFTAITKANAKPIRKTSFGFIWVVDGNVAALKQQGALGAYRNLPISPEIAGCVAVIDAKTAAAFGI
jgi:hypothetical protein